MSKTEGILLATLGWNFADQPRPLLYFGPTEKNVKSISRDRVQPMIDGVPALAEGQGRDGGMFEKFLNGVRCGFGWAGSATELASHPAAIVLIDERDRMASLPGEGDPVTLGKARTSTYADGTVAIVSTPLAGRVGTKRDKTTGLVHWEVGDPEDIDSPTWQLWQQGTRQEWAWPCPSCGDYFIPRSDLLIYDTSNDPSLAPSLAEDTAGLACPSCGSIMRESEKADANARGAFVGPGQWIEGGEVRGELLPGTTASYWISGLCSNWVSFGERAHDLVKANLSGDEGQVQAVMNTGFGEIYAPTGEAPDWESVLELCGDYERGELTEGARILTAGVDVQEDRLVWVVRAWGSLVESWLVDYGELWGDTEESAVWFALQDLLGSTWDGLPIRRMGVDSGFRAKTVYQFCRNNPGAIPTKGRATMEREFSATKVQVNRNGKLVTDGLMLWHLDSDRAKSWVHSRIRLGPEHAAPFHLFAGVTEDYAKQVTAEARALDSKGAPVWVELRKANHLLDCEAIAFACARMEGVGNREMSSRSRARIEGSLEPVQPQPTRRQRLRRGKRSGGINI